MGGHSSSGRRIGRTEKKKSKKNKKRRKHAEEDSSSSSPSLSSSPYGDIPKRRKHGSSRRRRRMYDSDDGERELRREKERSRGKSRRERERKHKRRPPRRGENDRSGSSGDDDSESESCRNNPEAVIRGVLEEFPGVADDLRKLLQMIDDGQAVDIRGISEISLVKNLKKLFLSLNLKESDDRVFLLPSNVRPTMEVVGSIICSHVESNEEKPSCLNSENDVHSAQPDVACKVLEDANLATQCPDVDVPAPRRRIIGPEMPSADLLAAAAKLTEAEAELREAEVGGDTELFIGPPPPAVVAEAESANEAERFEEVTRIMGVEVESPYDVVGVNPKMSSEGIKKRYWKLSLMVHPDKCSHPQSHQAFIKLNKAFKDLQDPDKRKELDDKIKLKEEQEQFKAELKAMREAAQWRRQQGISMEGDDELLAEVEVKVEPKRDEWMTTLPPERKPGGMPMQSTSFSRTTKEGRGDTSAWTDAPSDRAQKAKMNYLEAYNEAAALASNEEKKRTSSDADLVDKYNKAKRSKSLVQQHQEKAASRPKRKSKQQAPVERAEWEGNHPWKPWDREKDLTAGRQSVKLDDDNMAQGLTSRFSSGSFQRNFL